MTGKLVASLTTRKAKSIDIIDKSIDFKSTLLNQPDAGSLPDQLLESVIGQQRAGGGWPRLLAALLLAFAGLRTLAGSASAGALLLGWLLCGTALFGLGCIATSCGNNAFATSPAANRALGWLCSAPLLLPFELHNKQHIKRRANETLRRLAGSRCARCSRHAGPCARQPGAHVRCAGRRWMWWSSSLAEWVQSSTSCGAGVSAAYLPYAGGAPVGGCVGLTNLVALYAAAAGALAALVWSQGAAGAAAAAMKYFGAPWVVYHLWRSVGSGAPSRIAVAGERDTHAHMHTNIRRGLAVIQSDARGEPQVAISVQLSQRALDVRVEVLDDGALLALARALRLQLHARLGRAELSLPELQQLIRGRVEALKTAREGLWVRLLALGFGQGAVEDWRWQPTVVRSALLLQQAMRGIRLQPDPPAAPLPVAPAPEAEAER
jgi:hypothetical protein